MDGLWPDVSTRSTTQKKTRSSSPCLKRIRSYRLATWLSGRNSTRTSTSLIGVNSSRRTEPDRAVSHTRWPRHTDPRISSSTRTRMPATSPFPTPCQGSHASPGGVPGASRLPVRPGRPGDHPGAVGAGPLARIHASGPGPWRGRPAPGEDPMGKMSRRYQSRSAHVAALFRLGCTAPHPTLMSGQGGEPPGGLRSERSCCGHGSGLPGVGAAMQCPRPPTPARRSPP